jgi:hypothetical protein
VCLNYLLGQSDEGLKHVVVSVHVGDDNTECCVVGEIIRPINNRIELVNESLQLGCIDLGHIIILIESDGDIDRIMVVQAGRGFTAHVVESV